MRKAINELGAAAARDRIARAIGVERENVGFSWTGERVDRIIISGRGETPHRPNPIEIQAIAAAGVLLGANGWEIEEEPAKAERRPLPEGWRWEEGVYLTRSDDGVSEIAQARMDEAVIYASERSVTVVASIPARSTDHAREIAERECWERGLFDANPRTGTIIGERSPASTALRRLVLRMIDRAEDGGMINSLVYPGAAAHLSDLCDAFVSELRAELAPKPSPAPRTTDGALTAYLLEHYPDEWRPGEDALALAIRLLGETQRIVDAAHEEAEASDASAKEMAAEIGKVRAELTIASSDRDRYWDGWSKTQGELNAANSRAAEAEHDRDVAREAARKAREERDEECQRRGHWHSDVVRAEEERDEARRELRAMRTKAASSIAEAHKARADLFEARDMAAAMELERDAAVADLTVLRGLCRGFAAKAGVPHG